MYFPVGIAAFAVGWGGGSLLSFVSIIAFEFIVAWAVVFFLTVITLLVRGGIRSFKDSS
ncbi:hypothetical protein O3Q51_16705 [Cryomorphaceae bacterium 1068]|nr:hypothetical protein [Cryomorphaceae bacterium 1068]